MSNLFGKVTDFKLEICKCINKRKLFQPNISFILKEYEQHTQLEIILATIHRLLSRNLQNIYILAQNIFFG